MTAIVRMFFFLFLTFFCVSTGYDFMTLALQWPPGIHRMTNNNWVPLYQFVIHGFWPSTKVDPQPRDCSSEAFASRHDTFNWPSSLRNDMFRYWPNLMGDPYFFWARQWEHHGTCAIDMFGTKLGPREYCYSTIAAYFAFISDEIADRLAELNIIPGQEYTRHDIVQGVKQVFKNKPMVDIPDVDVQCYFDRGTQKQYLRELWIYMKNNFQGIGIDFTSRSSDCDRNKKITF